MSKHWLLRIGNGNHFDNSSPKNIWGINSNYSCSKSFIKNVKIGDYLWFVKGNSNGKIKSVAIFTGIQDRIIGPIIDITFNNRELGWTEKDGNWDKEIHYKNLHDLDSNNLYSEIKGACTIRRYNQNCKINLPVYVQNI
jgi:hypothetical protein